MALSITLSLHHSDLVVVVDQRKLSSYPAGELAGVLSDQCGPGRPLSDWPSHRHEAPYTEAGSVKQTNNDTFTHYHNGMLCIHNLNVKRFCH